MPNIKISAIVAVTSLLLAAKSDAITVNAVAATTTMGAGFGTSLANTINGVGLSAFPSLTATHVGTLPGNSWVSSSGILNGLITFDLGGSFNIDGFSFWNQNNGGPGALGSTGIRNVFVSSSLDGIAYLPILGAPTTFSQVTGNTAAPEVFSFAPGSANYIRFTVVNNYGDTAQTGFAEVAFSSSAGASLPESGSTFLILGLGLAGLVAVSRRLNPSPSST